MQHPFRDRVSLVRGKFHGFRADVDQQFALKCKKELVFLIMFVPVEFALQDAETDDAVVDPTQRLIVPLFLAVGNQLGDIDDLPEVEPRFQIAVVFALCAQFSCLSDHTRPAQMRALGFGNRRPTGTRHTR